MSRTDQVEDRYSGKIRLARVEKARLTRLAMLIFAALVLAPGAAPVTPAGTNQRAGRPPTAIDTAMGERIDAAANRVLREERAPGFSVAVAKGGRLDFAKGYGFADLERRIPARPDTIYRTGSVGKQFTAATLVRLAEHGRLSLDDPLGRFLPNYPARLKGITVRQLLSHTAGLREINGIPQFSRTQGIGLSPKKALELIARQPLEFEPGTRWSYSNSNYLLAGAIIEAVTGRPAAEFMIGEVLRPLGMEDTSACRRQLRSKQWARGYDSQDHGGWSRAARLGRSPTLITARPINMEIVSTAGGFCSTPIDLMRWTQTLHYSDFLSPQSRREMIEPARLADGRKVPYSLGLQWRRFGGHRALSHGGSIWGFSSAVAHFPDDAVTVALMVNALLPDEEAKHLWTGILAAVFDEEAGGWQEIEFDPALDRTPPRSLR